MSVKKHIPNAITLLNMFSGCIAVYYAFQNQLLIAALFTFLGIFFDFFDGFFARILKAQSDLGLQLDSMADMVTSGVVPGIFMFQLLTQANTTGCEYVSFLGFLITLGSGYRLANFNIDTRQTTSFIGLPTPANSLFIISVALVTIYQPHFFVADWFSNVWILLIVTLLSCYLLNAELPLFALKFKSWDFKSNWYRYVFLMLSVVLIGGFTYAGILGVILLYVGMSVFLKASSK